MPVQSLKCLAKPLFAKKLFHKLSTIRQKTIVYQQKPSAKDRNDPFVPVGNVKNSTVILTAAALPLVRIFLCTAIE